MLILYSPRIKLYLSLLCDGQDTPRILNLFWPPALTRYIDNWSVSTGGRRGHRALSHDEKQQKPGNIQIEKEKTQKGPVAVSKYLKCYHREMDWDCTGWLRRWELRPINEKCRGTSFQHCLRKNFLCLMLTVRGCLRK